MFMMRTPCLHAAFQKELEESSPYTQTTPSLQRNPTITVDTRAIVHNVYRVKQLAPKSKVLAMVKANAYGHGLIPVVQAITHHVDAFGVATVQELAAIRAHSQKKVVLIEGVCNTDEWEYAAQQNTLCVIHHAYQVDLAKSKPHTHIPLWLKINTGMNRLGLMPRDALQTFIQLHQLGYHITLCTHFANADEPEHPLNQQQKQVFFDLKHRIEAELNTSIPFSMANSAALIHWPETHGAWVRPGIMLYGSSPMPQQRTAQQLQLKPAMQFASRIIACYGVAAGVSIGYGAQFITQHPTQLAIVAVGYGDGYPRVVNPNACVCIHGHFYPIIGRVSMDMLAVDVSGAAAHAAQPTIGDHVELWGSQCTVDDTAIAANTIGYELLCRLTNRPTRHYV